MGAIESYNWSGARIVKEVLPLLNRGDKFFTSVKATWRVPTVEHHDIESEPCSAAWIGLDGGTFGLQKPPIVLQAGIYHKITAKVPIYTPFFGLDEGKPSAGVDVYLNAPFVNPLKNTSITISARDTITVELAYFPASGASLAYAIATFTISGSATQPPPAKITLSGPPIGGDTVEWVFERISKDNDSAKRDFRNSYYHLGKHDAVDFRDAAAGTDQGNSVSPDQGDSINMHDVDSWPALLTAGIALRGEVQIKHRYR